MRVPVAAELALTGIVWDRQARSVNVSLTLPRAAVAALEIYDLSGRRWAAQRLEGLKAGAHRVEIGAKVLLPPGVYFARLRQADRSVAPHLTDRLRHRCSLYCLNPDMMKPLRGLLTAAAASNGYAVGYWYWELEFLPRA